MGVYNGSLTSERDPEDVPHYISETSLWKGMVRYWSDGKWYLCES